MKLIKMAFLIFLSSLSLIAVTSGNGPKTRSDLYNDACNISERLNSEFVAKSIAGGNTEQVKKMIRSGLDINSLSILVRHQDGGWHGWNYATPLMIAAGANQIEMAKMLIEKGALIDQIDLNGRTALTIAVSHTNLGDFKEMAELLIKSGADVNKIVCLPRPNSWQIGSFGRKVHMTPLCMAVVGNSHDMVKLLLDNGASIDICSENLWRIAAIRNDSKMINLLLSRSSDWQKKKLVMYALKDVSYGILHGLAWSAYSYVFVDIIFKKYSTTPKRAAALLAIAAATKAVFGRNIKDHLAFHTIFNIYKTIPARAAALLGAMAAEGVVTRLFFLTRAPVQSQIAA